MFSQRDYRTRRLVDVKLRTRRVVAVRPKESVLRAGLELSLLQRLNCIVGESKRKPINDAHDVD